MRTPSPALSPRPPRRRTDHAQQIQAIHQAMFELLLTQGFDRLTMGAIATRAQMSKQTLYKHYASKEALIAALVQHNATQINTTLETLSKDNPLPLNESLKRVGDQLVRLLTSEKSILINRIAIASASTNASLGQLLFTFGRQMTLPTLTTLISQAIKNTKPSFEISPSDMAETFIGLLMGDLQVRCLLGVATTPNEQSITARVELAVKQFMHLLEN